MIEMLYASAGNTIGFRISDRFTGHDLSDIFLPQLKRLRDEYGTIRLLIEVKDFEGEDISDVLRDPEQTAVFEVVRRVAVIGETRGMWTDGRVHSLIAGGDTEIRLFPGEQKEEAWNWVSAGGKHTATVAPSFGQR